MKGTQEANMQDTIFHNRAPKYPNNTRQVKILAKGVKFQQFSIKLRMALKKKKEAMKTREWFGKKKNSFFKNSLCFNMTEQKL